MQTDSGPLRHAALANSLRACQLFSAVPGDELAIIASLAVQKSLPKGTYLFREGDPSEGFYVVRSGAIKIHRVSPTGKEQVIQVFRNGESFAEATLCTATGYPADAHSVEDSTVLLIPKGGFLQLLRSKPELALRMLAAMSQHLRVLVGLLDDLTLKDVEARLANWLLKQCGMQRSRPVIIELDRTKRLLAAELGTASETLSRTFAKFRAQKLIRISGKTITVLDPGELEKVLKRHLGEP